MKDIKTYILNTVCDLVSDFLYYDRKEDEKLQLGNIENAILAKYITIEEITNAFREELRRRVS